MGAWKYILKKFFQAFLTLLFVLAVNFFLFRVLPGDPAKSVARSLKLSLEDTQKLRVEFGLDQPVFPNQFVLYVENTVTGNLGTSYITARPVSEAIATRVWWTLLLVGTSTVLATGLGIIVGIKGAWRRGGTFDVGSLGVSLTLYSMPEGWLGMMLLTFFAVTLHVFPAGQAQSAPPPAGAIPQFVDILNHLFLPCLTLTLGYIGEYSIIMRASLLETINEDFVGTARAKGLLDKNVRRHHAVPNALLPIVTLVVLNFGYILGGAIVVEYVFSYPGLGAFTVEAINANDFPVIQGVFLLTSAAVIFANFIADLLYVYLDPRVREV
jgi:peptide/nickel transport system permease protein